MSNYSLHVLYEDNHLLVVNKPAGLPTMGVADDRPSLLALAREYVKQKYDKPGNVYLGVVSRLDAPVTGVLVIARTSKSAGRLNEAFRSRAVEKIYLALGEGQIEPPDGCLEHHLRKDERHRRMHTTSPKTPGAQQAVLHYRTREILNDRSLLEIALETGRKHQIRVQLAKSGHPILGDRKYGATTPFAKGIALHSWRITLDHPVRREPLIVTAPLPGYWPKLNSMPAADENSPARELP
ncbi:MAG: RluA family pseudouridine synthase [Aeoliella sp.]